MRSYRIRVGLNPVRLVSLWEGKTETQIDAQGEFHVMIEAEIGVTELQAKECQGLMATTRN